MSSGQPASGDTLLAVRLRGRRVVVVGAGRVAAGKLRPLLAAEADLVIVAPSAETEVADLAARGRLVWRRRAYEPADLDGAFLVVAGTSDAAVNDRIARDADARATWCVRVDRGEGAAGSAAIPAAVRRGALTLGVSTAGLAPALSRRLAQELGAAYGPEYAELVALLGTVRTDPAVRAHLAGLDDDARRQAWRTVLDLDILSRIRSGQSTIAREEATACLLSVSA